MIIKLIEADGFRNLEEIYIKPHPGFNIITGMNAQGKTNLMEAVWLMTGCKSFRGAPDYELIGNDKNKMSASICFDDGRREQTIGIKMDRKKPRDKNITLNKVKVKSTGGIFGVFRCVVFTPDDIDLIRGGPEKRRSFMDMCSCQLRAKNLETVKVFDSLLSQRNAAIKQYVNGGCEQNLFDVWSTHLAIMGAYITKKRYVYIKSLNEVCSELYSRVTGNKEKLEIRYIPNMFRDNPELCLRMNANEIYGQRMIEAMEDDCRMGYTTRGAHRDDLLITIDGMNVRDYGSQGQKKTAALVMKLGQAKLYSERMNENPVVLLDDVMGELDESRRRRVLEIVDGMQVFITACNERSVHDEIPGKHFIMENGRTVILERW